MSEEDRRAFEALPYQTKQLLRKRVQRGMALLDKRLGVVWPFHIDMHELNLGQACECVLGQLAVDIMPKRQWSWNGRRRWVPRYEHAVKTLKLSASQQVTHGFMVGDGYGIDALTHVWAQNIKRRR